MIKNNGMHPQGVRTTHNFAEWKRSFLLYGQETGRIFWRIPYIHVHAFIYAIYKYVFNCR